MDTLIAYRYEDQMYCSESLSGDYYLEGPRIILREFKIIKFTPKGFWIQTYFVTYPPESNKRWIGTENRKKYACLSKEEALVSFQKRKNRQVNILRSQLDRATQALAMAKAMVPQVSIR